MDKILPIETLRLYKEAVQILHKNGIEFDKEKLLNNPEICIEIINLLRERYSVQ